MIQITKANSHSAFTLIELLISIAIIGILTSFGFFAFQNALGKARDSQRRNDLRQLQTALQAYYNDYNSYPSTVGVPGCGSAGALAPRCGEGSGYGSKSTDYIIGLTPKYIRRLPNDPRAGKNNLVNDPACDSTRTGYLYQSDGTDYKLIAACSPEQPLNNPKDALYDPARPIHSWAVYSDAASGW